MENFGLQTQLNHARQKLNAADVTHAYWQAEVNKLEQRLISEREPAPGKTIMFCHSYNGEMVSTVVAHRSAANRRWYATDRTNNRDWEWMIEHYPALAEGHFVVMVPEKPMECE